MKLEATEACVALIELLKSKHGDLMFHQSGGCCDGSSPMCYPLGEFKVARVYTELYPYKMDSQQVHRRVSLDRQL